jgi:uncharacterized protein YjbI with pentapeptide repeats
MFRRFGAAPLAAAFVIVLAAGEALAECTAFPAPGVEWRRCLHDGDNLSETDLTGADLRDSSFRRTVFDDAILAGIRARRARFTSASMVRVDLTGADLTLAEFTSADLTEASFVGATLRRTRFVNATLRGADFTDAETLEADFARADLSGAIWTDGRTLCAEGSIGSCRPSRAERTGEISN